MYLWGEKRPILSTEGIEITNVTMGGESEEQYDETGDLFYYQASLSLEIQTDWEIHLPLSLTISRIAPASGLAGVKAGLAPVQPTAAGGLLLQTLPIMPGRNNSFERIG
jgi:hypothetical protein